MVSSTTVNASIDSGKGSDLANNITGTVSYAMLLKSETSRKSVNFHTLLSPAGNGADVAISIESVSVVHERLSNIVYGFFLGKRVAYPIVENYIPRQAVRGVLLSGTKKQVGLTRQEVSNSNPFDALNTVGNDGDLALGRLTTTPLAERINDLERQMLDGKLVLVDDNGMPPEKIDDPVNADSDMVWEIRVGMNNGERLLMKSRMMMMTLMIFDNSNTSTTPIIDKIGKFKDLLIGGQAVLVDEARNLLEKVECPGDYDSKDEVASVDNDMARFMASERVGFGTQSLLEQ
ncbi:hypothetical protein Tco_1316220 [Tanacetum coccineum]